MPCVIADCPFTIVWHWDCLMDYRLFPQDLVFLSPWKEEMEVCACGWKPKGDRMKEAERAESGISPLLNMAQSQLHSYNSPEDHCLGVHSLAWTREWPSCLRGTIIPTQHPPAPGQHLALTGQVQKRDFVFVFVCDYTLYQWLYSRHLHFRQKKK